MLLTTVVNRRFATTLDAAASSSGENIPPTLGIAWLLPERRFDAFDRLPMTFGRAEDNSACLPGNQVSRVHAQISGSEGSLVLADLGSKNGTFVNRGRTTSAPLTRGDVVRMGNWLGVVMQLRPGQDVLT